ncbi:MULTISPECIES: helix-turn-helix domain-containing protein [unclassified Streptomyces]|uniref:helix-turn-helix domain-containing protein n=1 Tax=unclassified Streptomyces TaxID=2593676 RepID=UPI0019083364|nr:helix-turn-helix domain-containing protein [Streptomyces sp. HSG2]
MHQEARSTATTTRHRHPLAALRAKAGYTHGEYARLIATTHDRLGFGHMAARREKVSRWESGRAVPERTAQLAIAHVHGVPEEDVDRLAWPEWLHLAHGDARQLEFPWTPAAVPEAILDAVAARRQTRQGYLMATGWAAMSLAENWVDAMTEALDWASGGAAPRHATSDREPGSIDAEPGSVLQACTRLRTLNSFAGQFTAGWLVPASEHELRYLADHFASGPPSLARVPSGAGQGLLTLAAESLSLCGFIARLQGEHVGAQRYYVAGLRCATAAGDAEIAAAIMTLHAAQYLDLRLHGEATELLQSARTVLRRSGVRVGDPALPSLIHAQIARVYAQRGDDVGRRRAIRAARNAFVSAPAQEPSTILPLRGDRWLQLLDGVSLLESGRPDQAIKCFDPVLSDHEPPLTLPPSARSLYLLRAAEAQVALGDAAGSAASVAEATALLGGVRPAASTQVRLALRTYAHLPEVEALLAAAD